MTAEISTDQSQRGLIMDLSIVCVHPAFTLGIPTAHVNARALDVLGQGLSQ